ncbi:hypothetical protein GQR58_003956 [Nymphon striatum]|nr:hypothetical protein GQR58_003956 [Nymphon striatum]
MNNALERLDGYWDGKVHDGFRVSSIEMKCEVNGGFETFYNDYLSVKEMFDSSLQKNNESEELSKILMELRFLVKHMDRRFGMVVFRRRACGDTDCECYNSDIHAVKTMKLPIRLTEDAIPTIFSNCPQYMNSGSASRTTTRVSAEQRCASENDMIMADISSMHNDDKIYTFSDVIAKLDGEKSFLPAGFNWIVKDQRLFLLYITVDDLIPLIAASIILEEDLTTNVTIDQLILDNNLFSSFLSKSRIIETFSALKNIMALVKSRVTSTELQLDSVIGVVQAKLRQLAEMEESKCGQLEFLGEQLNLLFKPKHGRRYFEKCIVASYLLHAASPNGYNELRNQHILCLPSERTLRSITSKFLCPTLYRAITFSDDDCVHAEKDYKMSTGFKSIRKAHTKNVLTPERSSTPLSSDEEIAMSKFPAKPAARPPPQGSLGQRDPHTPIQMRERISVTPRQINQPSPIETKEIQRNTKNREEIKSTIAEPPKPKGRIPVNLKGTTTTPSAPKDDPVLSGEFDLLGFSGYSQNRNRNEFACDYSSYHDIIEE